MQAIFFKVTQGYNHVTGYSLNLRPGLERSYQLGKVTYGYKNTPLYVFSDFEHALRYKYADMQGWLGTHHIWICLCMPWRGKDYTATVEHEKWALLAPTTYNVPHWWNSSRIFVNYSMDRMQHTPHGTRAVEWVLPLALVHDQNEWRYRR